MGKIKPSATPREGVVYEHDATPTSQIVGRSSARVVRVAEPNSTRVRIKTKINQLLCADGADAAMAVHTQNARQAAAYP